MEYSRRILITGGAGFIGGNLVKYMVNKYPNYLIVNYDSLTYAANLGYLMDIKDRDNYVFVNGNICDATTVAETLRKYDIDGIIHLAAESHVDNSISSASPFVLTNVFGTFTMLDEAKKYWVTTENGFDGKLFYHVSTDEVYGDLPLDTDEKFLETNKYFPHSPYSASKASSDHFVRAYNRTFNLPIVISNCSNNYGPNQHHEKLIPLVIEKIYRNENIPIYGKGLNVRDWLYVGDHVSAIDCIFHKGAIGETYNIGGNNEMTNIEIVKKIISICDKKLGRKDGESLKLITYVSDRKGHDLRYAICADKLKDELGWVPKKNFDEGISETIDYYLSKLK